jgi:oligopeptide/dipeptide ABC transporter ATP-binding protein
MSNQQEKEYLLSVEDLRKDFGSRGGWLQGRGATVHAVNGISFRIPKGKTFSLVGESGCGKTTAGRLILRLVEPTSGQVIFDGADLLALRTADLRAIRRRVQMVFQDPFSSLNPRMSVAAMIEEPLVVHRIGTKTDRRDRVYELLELVGLPRESANRYPHQFSGGQRQRIGIARALAAEPDFIIADEPVSSLDVSIQAQILNLMKDLQDRLGLTYLFIAHDLSVVRHFSDYVGVMYLGKIVEMAPVDRLFENPLHPYTKALLRAVPVEHPRKRGKRTILQGQVPSPRDLPPGCHFCPRCPDAMAVCQRDVPERVNREGNHEVSCHLYEPEV